MFKTDECNSFWWRLLNEEWVLQKFTKLYIPVFQKLVTQSKIDLKYNANVIAADNLNSYHDPQKPNQIHLSDSYTGKTQIQS